MRLQVEGVDKVAGEIESDLGIVLFVFLGAATGTPYIVFISTSGM